MKSLLAARDLPYCLWGAALVLCACLYGMLLGAPGRDAGLTQAVPGFTVAEPHVGQVRVIPQASAALVSPCAARDSLLAVGEASQAEL